MALLAALEWLKERRPIASPHPAYMDELVEWEVAWRKRPSLDSERYSDNRYSRAEDLKLLLTPRSARAEAKEEDVWRPSAPPEAHTSFYVRNTPSPRRRDVWRGV